MVSAIKPVTVELVVAALLPSISSQSLSPSSSVAGSSTVALTS